MRLFLAFNLPPEVKKPIVDLLALYKIRYPQGVKWVNPDQLHVTVQFIGEVKSDDLKEIKTYIREHIEEIDPLALHYLGCEIHPAHHPRLVWLKWSSQDKALSKFVSQFRYELKEMGYEPDSKNLQFHITLGRIKFQLPVEAEREINAAFLPLTDTVLDELVLYESRLTPNGPVYHALEEFEVI